MKSSLRYPLSILKWQRIMSWISAFVLSGLLLALNARATVTLPFYDGFNYAEGNLNAVSGGNWVVGNGSTSFEIAVSNAATLPAPAVSVAALETAISNE